MKLFENAHSLGKDNRCWLSLARDLLAAKHSIYITGWDFDAHLRLDRSTNVTLMQLLNDAAARGVQVRLVLYKDSPKPTTPMTLGYDGNGIRGVLDLNWHGNVKLGLGRPRRHHMDRFGFSLHQKTVCIDEGVAYIGGLDLARGRYDDGLYSIVMPEPSAAYDTDWCNRELDSDRNLPRQPWRDIHSRIEGGGLVTDIVNNFRERWNIIFPGDSMHESEIRIPMQHLLRLDEPASLWTGQMYRSMIEAKEDSILLGYLRAIRCATKFVYLESEFFISGSCKWRKRRPGMVINTIAEVLADQICNKGICVYVVVPLYPECSVDGPLAFPFGDLINIQIRTMEMLYREVTLACPDKKPANHILFAQLDAHIL